MKVYLENYGCTMNQHLGERLEEMLLLSGSRVVQTPDEAEAIVINTCSVKAKTERRMLRRIKELRRGYPEAKLVVGGCLPTVQGDEVKEIAPDAWRFGTEEYELIPIHLAKGTKGTAEGKQTRVRHRAGIGIVPISSGCLGECTYCLVRLIKGPLRSRPPGEILGEIMEHRLSGAHEIWLTSQDLAAYGADGGSCDLPSLLGEVLEASDGMMIRLGMMNPASLLPVIDEMVEVFRNPHVYSFAHIPLQSGSDRVLASMQRGYQVRDWVELVARLRGSSEEFTMSTDLIVGYPTETGRDLRDTLDLVEATRPDQVNLSRYEHRPGTPASNLKALPGSEVKRRCKIAGQTTSRISRELNCQWVGRTVEVCISEKARRAGWLGRTPSYKPVVLAGGNEELGSRVQARITGATDIHLLGQNLGLPP
jgi:MiaB-like tRNA modifying enzyme